MPVDWTPIVLPVFLLIPIGIIVGLVIYAQKNRPEISRPGIDPPPSMQCWKCDYDLNGLVGEACPECGHPLSERQVAMLRSEGNVRETAGESII